MSTLEHVQSWWRCPNYKENKSYTAPKKALKEDLDPSAEEPKDLADGRHKFGIPWAKEEYERTLGWIRGLDAKATDAIRFDFTAAALMVTVVAFEVGGPAIFVAVSALLVAAALAILLIRATPVPTPLTVGDEPDEVLYAMQVIESDEPRTPEEFDMYYFHMLMVAELGLRVINVWKMKQLNRSYWFTMAGLTLFSIAILFG